MEKDRDWQGLVEDRIREAMERGDFDNLKGKGEPLNLKRNPWAGDWELAFHILENAGYAPEWIERDKEIRAELAALRGLLDRHIVWHRAALAALAGAPAQAMRQRHAELDRARARAAEIYRERAVALNNQIDTCNLVAPSARVHRPRIDVENEIRAFECACSEQEQP
jgi:DnaJ family protein C protein 28